MTRAFASIFAVILFAFSSSQAIGAEVDNSPQVMLQQVGEQLFSEIGKVNQDGTAKRAELAKIIDERLMPYIDIKFVSYKLLGKHIKTIKRPQALAFMDAVRHYLGNTYAGALAKYKGQELVFEPEKSAQGEKYITVKAHILDDSAPTIDLDFKLRRGKDGQWKVYDMVAEGISLLSAKQKEIITRISQVGIDKVIEELKVG